MNMLVMPTLFHALFGYRIRERNCLVNSTTLYVSKIQVLIYISVMIIKPIHIERYFGEFLS